MVSIGETWPKLEMLCLPTQIMFTSGSYLPISSTVGSFEGIDRQVWLPCLRKVCAVTDQSKFTIEVRMSGVELQQLKALFVKQWPPLADLLDDTDLNQLWTDSQIQKCGKHPGSFRGNIACAAIGTGHCCTFEACHR